MGNQDSRLEQVDPEGLKPDDGQDATDLVCLGGSDMGVACSMPSNVPKLSRECLEYFNRFDRNGDGLLSLPEVETLAKAVCRAWKVPVLELDVLQRLFQKHLAAEAIGLSCHGFAAVADEFMGLMVERHPELTVPNIAQVLAAQGQLDGCMLHMGLPTSERSLQSMGSTGICVKLVQITGQPGTLLATEDRLCCIIELQRNGRILPRRVSRIAFPDPSSRQGCWYFDSQTFVFSERCLLARPGDVLLSLQIRQSTRWCSRMLAKVDNVALPTAGEVTLDMRNPQGIVEAKVKLEAGWRCSEDLTKFMGRALREEVREGNLEQTRHLLEVSTEEAVAALAGSEDRVDGRTVLMIAAGLPQGTPLVRDLLRHTEGLRVATDRCGAMPVHYAALNGSLESLAAILGSGALPDQPAAELGGLTPLMLASFRCSPDHVRLLIAHGANVAKQDDFGLPAFGWSVSSTGEGALRGKQDKWIQECMRMDAAALRAHFKVFDKARCETVALLLEELWKVQPPLRRGGSSPEAGDAEEFTAALQNTWLPIAEHCASYGYMTDEKITPQNVFHWIFNEQMLRLCADLSLYRRLMGALFHASMEEGSEQLSMRMLEDLSVIFEVSTSICMSKDDPDEHDALMKLALDEFAWSQSVLGIAVESRKARLAYTLLSEDGGPLGYSPIGLPSNAVRLFALAVQSQHEELARAVRERLPSDLIRDCWEDPAVTPGTGAVDCCPVCFNPLAGIAGVMLLGDFHTVHQTGDPQHLACRHLVCRDCWDKMGYKCPLCRAEFQDVDLWPDLIMDPLGWLRFAACKAGDIHPHHGIEPHPRSRVCAPPRASKEDLERAIPAALPVDVQQLRAAMAGEGGLFQQWDIDGDGFIGVEDFLEPRDGLMRWLLVHILEQERQTNMSLPDPSGDRQGWVRWYASCVGVTNNYRRVPSNPTVSCLRGVFLTRGDALCAVMRQAGVSSLDTEMVNRFKAWLEEDWPKWADRSEGALAYDAHGVVHFTTFISHGGLGEALLEQAAAVKLERAIELLTSSSADPARQAEALVGLCRHAPAFGQFSSTSTGPGSGTAAEGHQEQTSDCSLHANHDLEKYRAVLEQVLRALDQHGRHLRVVAWASRTLVLLVIGPGKGMPSDPAEEVDWPQVLKAFLAEGLAERFAIMAGEKFSLQTVPVIVKAIVDLCVHTRACGDQRSFREVMAMISLLLRVLVRSNSAEAAKVLQDILAGFAAKEAQRQTICTRAFSAVSACVLLADLPSVLQHWEKSGFLSTVWVGARALSLSGAQVGQQVEVCCNGGWKVGTISRTPSAEASSPRDECWVVSCGGPADAGGTVIYSRHVWAPGWQDAVAMQQRDYQALLLALATGPPRPLRSARAIRRALLSSIVTTGLATKAREEAAVPHGPVVKAGTSSNILVRTGDIVWLQVPVDVARKLQTQRHGDWSEQMAFCLDCPGRVIETITGPPRLRVSHGCFGVFLWNPAIVTKAVSSREWLAFEEQHGPVVVGDEVLLCPEQHRAVPLQIGHGGWSMRMANCLGRYGRVLGINTRGDVRIDTPGMGSFIWNPATIEPPAGGSALALCAHAVSLMDDEGAALLLLLILSNLTSESGVEANEDDIAASFEDIFHALEQSGDWKSTPIALRAYGALLLLAAVVDFQQTCIGNPDDFARLRLSDLTTTGSRALLDRCAAVQWPAAHMGGVSFANVVAGDVDLAHAASRWILAFFAARHHRLCRETGYANPRAAEQPAPSS